jgi:pyrroline-5-carboxylate reductase
MAIGKGVWKRMNKMSLGIIGYGKMGSSLVKGAINSKLLKAADVSVCDADSSRTDLARREGLNSVDGLKGIIGADAILLAVKPKDMHSVLDELKELASPDQKLFISIAAGVKLSTIEARLGGRPRVIRVMPNIAASVNEAAVVFIPNRWADAKDIAFVESLLKGVGLAIRLDEESHIDAVTGISGSGPAYFFLMMKAMEEVGRRFGLPDTLVRSLVAQTCKGAGALALQCDTAFDHLISNVASPGGTTEEALKVMESEGFSKIVVNAVSAAIEKSHKMSKS